jgi:hypothetical protein
VDENGETRLQLIGQRHGLLKGHEHVNTGIHLGVMVLSLRNTEEAIDLGKQDRQGAAVAQHADEHGWGRFGQRAAELLPDALRDQGVDLAGADHLPT